MIDPTVNLLRDHLQRRANLAKLLSKVCFTLAILAGTAATSMLLAAWWAL